MKFHSLAIVACIGLVCMSTLAQVSAVTSYCGIECSTISDPELVVLCNDASDRLEYVNTELEPDFTSLYKCDGVVSSPAPARDAWMYNSINSAFVRFSTTNVF